MEEYHEKRKETRREERKEMWSKRDWQAEEGKGASPDPAQAEEDWQKEEMLKVLRKVRQNMNKKVSQKKEVTKIPLLMKQQQKALAEAQQALRRIALLKMKNKNSWQKRGKQNIVPKVKKT